MIRNGRFWDHRKYWIRKLGNQWAVDGPRWQQAEWTRSFPGAVDEMLRMMQENKNESLNQVNASYNCVMGSRDVRQQPSYC